MAAIISSRRSLYYFQHLCRHRRFSSTAAAILNPNNPTSTLTAKEKSKLALSLLKSEKNPDTILSICRAAALTPDTHLDRVAFSAAIRSLASSSSFVAIRSVINESSLLDIENNDSHRAHAIVLFGQAGLFEDAIRLFDEMPSPKNVKCFNSLLFAGVLAKKHNEVARIFKEYPKTLGFEPDLNSYNNVILSFSESGSSRSVYSLLDEMTNKGMKPNLTSYNHFITGLYSEGKADDVKKVLELMSNNGCPPAVSTYNNMIKSLCKLGKMAEAKSLLQKMVSSRKDTIQPNSVSYRNIIFGFCKEGNLEEAKTLFVDMCSKGCSPSGECYFILIYYLCQGGQFEEALKYCKQSMEKQWIPNLTTMKILVKGLVGCSRIEEAKEIVEALKVRFPEKVEMWKEVDEIF